MYDAIVVGARCAGSPVGMLLARAGHKVLIVERDTFPSDTLSTAHMQPDAVIRMTKWGLIDRLIAAGTPPYAKMNVGVGDIEMQTPPAEIPAYAPRRTVLDPILMQAARESGAEVREGCSVQEVLKDAEGRVTGVRLQQNGSDAGTESARIVIGADGRNSVVARAVDAPKYNEFPGLTTGFYSFYTGLDQDMGHIYFRGNHGIFVFPTNDKAACVAFEAPFARYDEIRKDPEAYLMGILEANAPAVAATVKAGKRIDKFFGMGGRESYYRKPFGPGWALVGDAGFLKDPFLGDGINDAFRDAELLAGAIDDGFSGRADLDEALAAYEERRNAATRDRYELTHDMCAALSTEITMELVGRIAMSNGALAAAAAG